MRTSAPELAPLFRSEMQLGLLGLVLLQPDRSWTHDELARVVGAPTSSVHRELRRALNAGLMRRDTTARPHRYQAATDSPVYPAMRDLLEYTVGVPARMSDALAGMDGVRAAAIHGGWAEGRIRPDSDIDVIVVTDGDRRRALQAVRRVARELGREADATVVDSKQFHEWLADSNPFISRILARPRIDLISDLEEAAAPHV